LIVRTAELTRLAAALRRAFTETLATFSLRSLVAESLPPLPPKRAVVRVLAAGKAAAPMMQGALDRWPDRIDRGLVVTVDDAPRAALPAHIDTLLAAHPIPDERSVLAADRALDLVRGLSTPDLVLVLISGGASSLLCAPISPFSLDEKRDLVRALIDSGATIRDINLVRRHASRIKGGRLAEAAAPARVLTLAVSDVIAGGLHDIGSGPSVPDPTTLDEARAVLARFAPSFLDRAPLTESLKPHAALRLRARVIAGPATFAERLAAHIAEVFRASSVSLAPSSAASPSLTVRALSADEGDVETLAARRLEQARSLAPGEAVVIPCEPTVLLPPNHGRGGRSGHLALRLLASLPDDVALLCGATDGADGSSGSAGAVITAALRASCDPVALDRALAIFDDAPLHAQIASRIETGPTGLNFADVHVLARLP